jgi:membrane protein implicated in regulation of membrane protease activity
MGILSFLLGILLWKPLKQYQAAEPSRSGQSSDFVGYEFTLSSLIDRETQSTHQFSGVTWCVELAREEGDKSLASGDRVRVVALHPGVLVVAQA